MNIKQYIKYLNQLRLKNKSRWFIDRTEVEGREITLECYDTWVQRLSIKDEPFKHSSPMDLKVGEWKMWLQDTLETEDAFTI